MAVSVFEVAISRMPSPDVAGGRLRACEYTSAPRSAAIPAAAVSQADPPRSWGRRRGIVRGALRRMRSAAVFQAARSGLDLAVGLFAALTWAFAAFVLGRHFISPVAGGLIAVAILSSGVVGEQCVIQRTAERHLDVRERHMSGAVGSAATVARRAVANRASSASSAGRGIVGPNERVE